MISTLLARSRPVFYKSQILFSTYWASLHLEVLQLLLGVFSARADRRHLRLGCVGNLALRFLRGGVFRKLFGEWDKFRGSWKVFSKWFGYIKAL